MKILESEKQSSLLGPFVSYEENNVLRIQPQELTLGAFFFARVSSCVKRSSVTKHPSLFVGTVSDDEEKKCFMILTPGANPIKPFTGVIYGFS